MTMYIQVPYYLEADLYQLQGMPEVSERKLLQAKELLPNEVIIDFALGELFYQQGRNPGSHFIIHKGVRA